MDKLLYCLSMAANEIKRRKPKNTPWFWWVINGFSNCIIAVVVWFIWICSCLGRDWSWERTTVGELGKPTGEVMPYSVDKIVEHIKSSYPDATELTVTRHPSLSVGYDVWVFKVDGGVSTDKAHTFRVSC